MSWIGIALGSSAILAIVNIIDSHILSRRLGRLGMYLMVLTPIYLVLGAILYILFPLPANVTVGLLLGVVGSSIIRGAAVGIMLYSLRTQEVSRVVPVVYAYPVLVAIMAMPVLGERLSWLSWLAIVIVIAGVLLVSINPGLKSQATTRRLLLLILTGFLFSGADISTKYLLTYFSFWKLFAFNALVMGAMFGTFSLRSGTYRLLRDSKNRNSTLVLILGNETIAVVALLLGTYAISSGPVAIVSALLGSRPIFVALIATGLSYLIPGFLRSEQVRERAAAKFIAAFMIVIGITLIYLG